MTTRIRHKDTPSPSGCRWCGWEERTHAMSYVPGHGIHTWEPPTMAQRKARIIANIAARKAASVPQIEAS